MLTLRIVNPDQLKRKLDLLIVDESDPHLLPLPERPPLIINGKVVSTIKRSKRAFLPPAPTPPPTPVPAPATAHTSSSSESSSESVTSST